MREELKPCPFCGGEAKMVELADRKRFITRCNGKCHEVALIANGREKAAETWNTRAEAEAKNTWLQCPKESPANLQQVLVYYDGEVSFCQYYEGGHAWCAENVDGYFRDVEDGSYYVNDGETIFWQPLPEPPKVNNDE